ncbi:MAG: single-stranded DNA-binding protein [Clostridia bacterium]|nr:single-stranded DNA-binding protein [Clostridia bacterium]MBR5264852.1 single-stranded DNA-binding protein [Clostridia bacterium]
MLNHITIMGRLVRDPDLRTTQSGVSVVSFTVAVDRDYKQGDEKVADFIDCTAWRGTAEFVSKNFTKGRMICVDGSLNSNKWTDKDGNNRISWYVQANSVYFADSKKDAPQPSPAAEVGNFKEAADDGDLPF